MNISADGLMLPADDNYPRDLLRNRMTKVDISIDGVIAKVSVYQEFVNDWDQDVDAVYSFPLPHDARATEFLYWFDDKIYTAVLQVKEQATNPGTGEGGIAARVNDYIGRNGIKIALDQIPAGKIQKVQLNYIQLLEYYKGSCSFEYPLETGQFVTYPLEHLEFDIKIRSNSEISGFDIPGFADARVLKSDTETLSLKVIAPKAFLNNDFKITYNTLIEQTGVDFYSVNNDTTPGHFGLVLRPPNHVDPDSLLPRRVIFLISNSTLMFGYKLNQSISAIDKILDSFSELDEFNIGVFHSTVQFWKNAPVAASADNIESARSYLSGISSGYGTNMSTALTQSLNMINNNSVSNAIVLFTDGYTNVDPRAVETINTHKTGIFPIAMGKKPNYARLEMLAAYNYGLVTYIEADDNMYNKMSRLMGQITQPVLKDVSIEFGAADVSELLPGKIPSTYAGSYFLITGRYDNSGTSALSLAGTSRSGLKAHDFMLEFTAESRKYKFIEYVWAKQMIDYLEWNIEIYGETAEWKEKLIEISLKYNIRCRYTAYIADYETEWTTGLHVDRDKGFFPEKSHLVYNYPNPFNPSTTIVFYLSPQSLREGPRFLKIYNALGQLVNIIDISHFGPGYHEVKFNALDWKGAMLPSGMYFVMLQAGGEQNMMRILLVR